MIRDKILEILDNHFINQMRMTTTILFSDNERMYQDSEMTINIVISDSIVRLSLRNWKSKKSFSRNIHISLFDVSIPESVINFIRGYVYSHSGVDSRDFLNNWYEWKKIELRDEKLNDLGI